MKRFKDKYKFKRNMDLKSIRQTAQNAYNELEGVYDFLNQKGRRELIVFEAILHIANESKTREEFISWFNAVANDSRLQNELLRKRMQAYLKQLK